MSSPPEFARPVPLMRVGGETYRREIAATEAERTALAQRFGLVSLDRLVAEVELLREPAGTILLTAAFEAVFEQECIVTLDPLQDSVSDQFQLRYGSPEQEASAPAGDDDPAFEPLTVDAIDIGEAVAQEFSLALPPFPRAADVTLEIEAPETPADGPFAALEKLRRGRSQ